jgi:hypothetical protein
MKGNELGLTKLEGESGREYQPCSSTTGTAEILRSESKFKTEIRDVDSFAETTCFRVPSPSFSIEHDKIAGFCGS